MKNNKKEKLENAKMNDRIQEDRRLRVGFYSTTSCQGCMLSVIFNENEFMNAVNAVKIDAFPFIKLELPDSKENKEQKFDVIFAEGLIANKEDEETIKKLRQKTKILIAFGACAATGCIPAYRKNLKEEDYSHLKFSRIERLQDTEAVPIHKIVKVDMTVPGCPPVHEDAIKAIKNILLKIEKTYEDPVCYECRLNNNECLLEKNRMCIGAITKGGCNAVCVNNNYECWGCRGLAKDANIEALKKIAKEKGFTEQEFDQRIKTFMTTQLNEKNKAAK